MSVLKNLKSLFIVEDEELIKASTSGSFKKAAATPIPAQPSAPTIQESEVGEKGQVSDKFMEVLLKAMEKNNLDGFDYLEYKKSLQSLAKMPMDEATRYKSAYAMAQTMGVKPEMLVKTAEHYIAALSREEKQFEQALTAQKQKQVQSKLSQLKQLEETIQQKAQRIKQLTQEIEKHQQQMATTKQQVSDASVKIETTKNNFIASYNALVSKIQEDIDKMKQYLGSN
jgi:DNA repair exonuclease SbcCD ATPase subunit